MTEYLRANAFAILRAIGRVKQLIDRGNLGLGGSRCFGNRDAIGLRVSINLSTEYHPARSRIEPAEVKATPTALGHTAGRVER